MGTGLDRLGIRFPLAEIVVLASFMTASAQPPGANPPPAGGSVPEFKKLIEYALHERVREAGRLFEDLKFAVLASEISFVATRPAR